MENEFEADNGSISQQDDEQVAIGDDMDGEEEINLDMILNDDLYLYSQYFILVFLYKCFILVFLYQYVISVIYIGFLFQYFHI